MAILRVYPTGEIVSRCIESKGCALMTTSKGDGTTAGYLFNPQRSRRIPIIFKATVPAAETFKNPRYICIEDRFSQPIAGNEIYDCKVVVDKKIFLITAYWKEDDHRNMAIESVGKGLRWKGEIAVVQVGKVLPFYKQPKDPSFVNRAVARCVFLPLGLSSHMTLSLDSLQNSTFVWHYLSRAQRTSTWTTSVRGSE